MGNGDYVNYEFNVYVDSNEHLIKSNKATVDGKEYYNKNMHKNLVKYLALIDKNEIKRIKDKYGYLEEVDYDTGYKLLFNLI